MDSIAARSFRLRQLANLADRRVFGYRESSDTSRRRWESEQGETARGHGRIRRRRFATDEAYARGLFCFNLRRFEGTRRGLSEAPDYILEKDRSNYRSISREMFEALRCPLVTFETLDAMSVCFRTLGLSMEQGHFLLPIPKRSRIKQKCSTRWIMCRMAGSK